MHDSPPLCEDAVLSLTSFIFQNGFYAVVKDTAAILFFMVWFQGLDREFFYLTGGTLNRVEQACPRRC